uniref:Replicase n=2 Tax=Prunevirus armeniacae TaxID=1343920 RepID=A0A0H3Y8P5_9VIRU|nr:replicase [Apricot vein clearing associated virus]
MAQILNYKSPFEKFFSNLEMAKKTEIISSAYKSLKQQLDLNGGHFAYEVSASLKEKLSSLGVPLHPTPYLAHSHPFSKMLENHILLNVLPGHITGSWVFSSIKPSKVESLATKGKKSVLKTVNRLLCAKDFGRYDVDTDSSVIRSISREAPDILPEPFIRAVKGRNVMIHDEVHHWTLDDMLGFLDRARPNRFVFSVVYPVELLAGILESQNPKMYKFQDSKSDKIVFFPDGKASEGYEQRANLRWLFCASHFRTSGSIWTVKRIYSAYSHHLFEVVPGNYFTDEIRFFNDFETIDLQCIFKSRFLCRDFVPISKDLVERVYSYLICLKKPDMQSAMAKLKQLMGDDLDVRVQVFFRSLVHRILNESECFSLFDVSIVNKWKKKFLDFAPDWLLHGFMTWKSGNFFDFLMSLKILQVEVPTEIVDSTFERNFVSLFDVDPHVSAPLVIKGFKRFMMPHSEVEKRVNRDEASHKVTIFRRPSSSSPHCKYAIELASIARSESSNCISGGVMMITLPKDRHIELLLESCNYCLLHEYLNTGESFSENYMNRMLADFLEDLEIVGKDCFQPSINGARSLPPEHVGSDVSWRRYKLVESALEELFGDLLNEELSSLQVEPSVPDSGCVADVFPDPSFSACIAISDTVGNGGKGPMVVSELAFVDPLETSVVSPISDAVGGTTFNSFPDFPIIPPINLALLENTYRPVTCSKIGNSFQIIQASADGRCFFHTLLSTSLFRGSVNNLVNTFCNFIKSLDEHEAARQVQEGAYPEGWMINLFLANYGIRMCCHQHSADGVTIETGSGPISFCSLKMENHFDYLRCLSSGVSKEHTGLLGKTTYPSGPIINALQGLKPKSFRGRSSFFFARSNEIDYGHNGFKYRTENWFAELDDFIPSDLIFNACLVQVYDRGSKISFHKDNEQCYAGYPILTVNFGLALFEFDSGEAFNLTDGDTILLSGDYLRKKRHRVTSLSDGRISLTFRRHVCRMNKSPLEFFSNDGKLGKNKCIIHAVAMALGQTSNTVANKIVAQRPDLLQCLVDDEMLDKQTTETICVIMNLHATIVNEDEGETMELNPEGLIKSSFSVLDEHMMVLSDVPNCRSKKGIDICMSPDLANSNCAANYEVTCQNLQVIQYQADHERAIKLMNSFLAGTTGAVLNELVFKGSRFFTFMDSVNERKSDFVEELSFVPGFAGSGKSLGLLNEVKRISREIHLAKEKKRMGKGNGKGHEKKERNRGNLKSMCIISPRRNLADDWETKLGPSALEHCSVTTFEVFFKASISKIKLIVVDELTLFPNGYIDLLIFRIRTESPDCKLILIFDPLQARYDSAQDRAILGSEHDVDLILGDSEVDYMYQSKRFESEELFNLFEDLKKDEVDAESRETGKGAKFRPRMYTNLLTMKVEEENQGNPIDVLLVGSFDEAGLFASSIKTMTFGESQGLTVDHAAILLSENSALSDDHRWLVALTRARKKVTFLCLHLSGLNGFLSTMENRLIAAVINKGLVTKKRLSSMVRAKLNYVKFKGLAGKDEVDREDRLEGDLFLKGVIFLGQRCEIVEPEIVEPVMAKEDMKTHFFVCQENFAQCYNFDNIRAKELREFRIGHRVTNQFIDNYEIVQHGQKKHTAGPLRFEAIYPRHCADDDVTFLMAVHKRLRFSNEMKEREKLERAHGTGSILFHNLIQKLGLNFTWDNQLFEECVNDFECKKLEKSKAVLANHSIRSDNDWSPNWVFLFMKSQLCTKYEKQYVDAKAGQTLACFQHMILVTFAPYCRYMEKQLRAQLPGEIYIHSNKNFNDLNEWVKKHAGDDLCVESDYEAFDASQDQYILSFELFMMRHMHIPEQIIQAYIDLKVNLGCKLGHFAIMRFTGEFSTFLFNTLANMAFTMCRYEWNSGDPIAFAGDDMCALKNLKVTDQFNNVFEKISLKAKTQVTEVPMFCGWRLSRFGIVKEPELVYNRFMVALERGNVKDCLENYAIEVSYAYSLGERLFDILKREEQLEYHQAVVRFIVKHLGNLRTKVKDLFAEQSDEDSC